MALYCSKSSMIDLDTSLLLQSYAINLIRGSWMQNQEESQC